MDRRSRFLIYLSGKTDKPMTYKQDYDKILTRLVNILSRLNDGEALSIKELSLEFGVSTRTLQRDFNHEGFWYLIALDSRNDKLKKYYLKNITNIEVLKDSFTSDSKLDEILDNALSIWFDRDKEPFEVKLSVSSEIAKYFKRKPISKTQTIESLFEDGSMEIVVKITHEMEIIPLVKYWIPHVKVLEPAWIKEKIEDDIRGYLRVLQEV